MALSYRNAVAVAEIVFYSPAFLIAGLLMFRHGWRRTAGWLFVAIFSLIRLIGASMQLATIHDPSNVSLYVGTLILDGIGLSPLLLSSLGLLSRALYSISKTKPTKLHLAAVHLIEILTIVALILSIVGATSLPSSSFLSRTQQTNTEMTVGVALFLAAFGLLCLLVLSTWPSMRHIEKGEKRLLIAVTLSLPFILVRLIYSSVSILGKNPDFSRTTGSTTIFLCMTLLMEACVVVIYEGTGLTLQRLSPDELSQIYASRQGPRRDDAQENGLGGKLARIGQKTLIGRLIMAISGKSSQSRY
ncbi:hypothetical protein ATEIFO6365_0002087100 [Aspergillus terreus]|uniref:DUF7702 domain-containing protein n=1 Tax=Aspergillus terreus TaxID=33178 RepID=A0A5M3YV47_ASPTE|nr:hypothetical protein ATETN484_0004069200 [Aspergillus terreus]GFF13760.1 hypothetical protein ATEIFO6365_0002087100 [Aspergillus terreus]